MFDEAQPEPVTSHDTPNATKFHPDDYDGPTEDRLDGTRSLEQHYSRLAEQNVGIYTYKWGDNTKLRPQDNLAILDAIMGQVELTDYQKRIARTEMDNALLSKWSSPNGVDAILVGICICAIILRNDWHSDRFYHPNRSDENNDELLNKFIREESYRDKDIRSCFQKVNNHITWQSTNWNRVDSTPA